MPDTHERRIQMKLLTRFRGEVWEPLRPVADGALEPLILDIAAIGMGAS